MVRTSGNPDDRKHGIQVIHTKPLTEREIESEDFDWSYKHSKEIQEEYDKLLKQQKVSDWDTSKKVELHEIARGIVKNRYGINY